MTLLDPEDLWQLHLLRQRQGDLRSSDDFLMALVIHPDEHSVPVVRGRLAVAERLGDDLHPTLESAEAQLRKAMETSDIRLRTEAVVQLGGLLLQRSDPAARELLERVLGSGFEDLEQEALYGLGYAYRQEQGEEAAIGAWRMAGMRGDVDLRAKALNNVGVAQFNLGNLGEAEIAFRQAASLPNPGQRAMAQLYSALILTRRGQADAAITEIERLQAEGAEQLLDAEGFPSGLLPLNLAGAYHLAGHEARAETLYLDLIAKESTASSLRFHAAVLVAQHRAGRGDAAGASEILARVESLDPENASQVRNALGIEMGPEQASSTPAQQVVQRPS